MVTRRSNTISVRIEGETDFKGAGEKARRQFAEMERNAGRAADGVESEFRRSADSVGDRFQRAEARVKASMRDIEADGKKAADEIESEFEAAGERISQVGDAIDLGDLSGSLTSQLQGLSAVGGPVAAAAGAAGALFGDEIAAGLSRGFNRRQNELSVEIRTGLDRIDVRAAGEAAGEAYSAGFGESLGDLAFSAAALEKEFSQFALGDDLAQITKEATLLQDSFGIDLPRSVEISRRAIANDMAPDVTSALNTIYAVATELPLTFDEGLDVLAEYAPTFARTNVDLGRFANLVVEVERSGAFENVSQGAEAIRELNTRLTETDELRDPIGRLGLDFDALRQKLADGDIIGVLGDISVALSDMEDRQEANRLAGQLFGSSVEDVSDRVGAAEVLFRGLNGTLDGTGEAIDGATRKMEESQTGFDKLQLGAEGAAAKLGGYLNIQASLVGALPELQNGVRAFSDEWLRLTGRLDETGDAAEDAKVQLEGVSGALDGVRDTAGGSRRIVRDLGDAASDAATDISGTALSVEDLRSELDLLFNFGADQGLRAIAESSDRVAEAFTDVNAEAVGAAGSIDITTDSGRRLQSELERLASTQSNNVELLREGQLTTDQFSAAQARAEAQIRAAGAAAGLSEDQVDGLIGKYLAVPDEVVTRVRAQDEATGVIQGIASALGGLRDKTITVRGRAVGFQNQGRVFFADGGVAHGPAVVGEEGPELARQGGRETIVGLRGPELVEFSRPTRIFTAEDTARMLGLPRFASGGVAYEPTIGLSGEYPGARSNPEIISPQDLMADTFREVLAEDRALRASTGPAIQIGQVVTPPGRRLDEELGRLVRLNLAGVG